MATCMTCGIHAVIQRYDMAINDVSLISTQDAFDSFEDVVRWPFDSGVLHYHIEYM